MLKFLCYIVCAVLIILLAAFFSAFSHPDGSSRHGNGCDKRLYGDPFFDDDPDLHESDESGYCSECGAYEGTDGDGW